ncbi:MAG: hypothetical protein VX589_21480 [Myxococcota bacterium]|nr:hypothetical protein [Myxococcota bacterium]
MAIGMRNRIRAQGHLLFCMLVFAGCGDDAQQETLGMSTQVDVQSSGTSAGGSAQLAPGEGRATAGDSAVDQPLLRLAEIYPIQRLDAGSMQALDAGWVEIQSSSSRPPILTGWSLEIDGVSTPLEQGVSLGPGARFLVYRPDALKTVDSRIRLLDPTGTVVDDTVVPALSPAVSWVKFDQGWQVGFPTPYENNRYWRRPTTTRYRIRLPRVLFYGRDAGLDSVRTIVANRVPIRSTERPARLHLRALLDTEERRIERAGQGTRLLYQASPGGQGGTAEAAFAQGESAGELTLRFDKPDEALSAQPIALNPRHVAYGHERASEVSPCGVRERFIVRAALPDDGLDMVTVNDVLLYFPDLVQRLPRIGRDFPLLRYDVGYQVEQCHQVQFDSTEVPVCVRLLYEQMNSIDDEDELPMTASIDWSLTGENLDNPGVRKASDELFHWLLESDLNVEVCLGD